MIVVSLPASLDYKSFEDVLRQMDEAGHDKLLFDARHLRWIDPYGMIALLSAGAVTRERFGEPAAMKIPMDTDVAGYLARMGFFLEAEKVFQLAGTPPRRFSRESEVLLEITPITTNSDVHQVVDRVQGRAGTILSRSLHYPPTAVMQFSVILSEVCQNVIEHAEAPGWVAAQVYNWSKRLGRQVLLVAVADVGRGFKGSLEDEHSGRFSDRWGDATALEAAFLHGSTRFPDAGRGQGIQQIRKQVRRWNGAISVRSGAARIADVAEWDDSQPLDEGLSWFPGAQVNIVLPASRADDEVTAEAP